MNKVDYVGACEELLKDDEYYKEENTDRSKEFANEIKGNIEEMNDLLTNKEKKFLLEDLDNPRTPVFYGLPKIHKIFDKIPPMRPIVSGYGSVTTKLSEFLDSLLKFQAQKCKSYIRDTKDFLRRLNSIKELPKNSILMTLDVSSLYTNIDQEEGAAACFRKLEERKKKDGREKDSGVF